MKCQSCRRRKAAHIVEDDQLGTLSVCAKCRREFYPTDAEQCEDEQAEMYRAERNAEFGSAGDYW
jgi:hypothetical protein